MNGRSGKVTVTHTFLLSSRHYPQVMTVVLLGGGHCSPLYLSYIASIHMNYVLGSQIVNERKSLFIKVFQIIKYSEMVEYHRFVTWWIDGGIKHQQLLTTELTTRQHVSLRVLLLLPVLFPKWLNLRLISRSPANLQELQKTEECVELH